MCGLLDWSIDAVNVVCDTLGGSALVHRLRIQIYSSSAGEGIHVHLVCLQAYSLSW